MKIRSDVVALLACCFLLAACKKDDASEPDPQPVPAPTTGTPTAIGTPVGAAMAMTVDGTGGSITSADGRLSINIPAGALTTPTEITVQPITNECFGGAGLAYELGPDGQHFDLPVTITFHYTAEDLIGTDAEALRIAFQDDAAIWNAFVDYSTDTIAGQVAVLSDHFTPFAAYTEFFLVPAAVGILVNENIELRVRCVKTYDSNVADTRPLFGEFNLEMVPTVSWTVNGDAFNLAFNGVLDYFGGSTINTYTAPALLQGMVHNPATIGVRWADDLGRVMLLASNIEVLNLAYTVVVNMSIPEQPLGPCTFGSYSDNASFSITSDNIVDPIGISNATGTYGEFYGNGGCSCVMTEEVDYFDLASVTIYDAGGGTFLVTLSTYTQLNPGYAGECAGDPFEGPAGTLWVADGVSFMVPFDGESHGYTVTAGGKTYAAYFTPG